MYNVFTVGVTYLNALWQAHRRGWSIVPSYVDALLDVQVCTSVMEPLAGEEDLTCVLAYLLTCLPVCLSACPPVCLSACLPVCLSIFLHATLFFHRFSTLTP
jgi:hypothetical protein